MELLLAVDGGLVVLEMMISGVGESVGVNVDVGVGVGVGVGVDVGVGVGVGVGNVLAGMLGNGKDSGCSLVEDIEVDTRSDVTAAPNIQVTPPG